MSGFYTLNPYSAETINHYDYMTSSALEHHVAVAQATFDRWSKEPLARRVEFLKRLAQLLRVHKTRLATLATTEMGKPIAQAEGEVEKCAKTCDFYAANAEVMLEDELVRTEHARSLVCHRPLGVVLAIMPWNFPYWQVIRCAVPATLAGNTVILKHADNTTGCALALAELWREAAGQEGLLSVLVADHSVLVEVIADSRVRAVSLTGSERAGSAVAELAGRHLKKVVLELGGSDPYLVLKDADVGLAARVGVEARFVNSGQSCVAAKRFIVTSEVYEEFVSLFVRATKARKVGDPRDPSVQIGPMARDDLRLNLTKQVDESVAQGAKVELGGRSEGGSGFFYLPTVMTGIKPVMPVFNDEVFGPVAPIIKAEDEAQALALANQTRYGLGAAIFSRDVERAQSLARYELDAGFVAINGMVVSDPRLPFGGVRASGFGRELARHGLFEFLNVKTMVVS
ncbi:MAG: NAD-dependent succinate-semialdehyde dehydrogenase [Deltaproteobacteria bacterium]|nr:NAD-dependent succinate-semialdehyde dehydrogenase [Deltaproteobacteria bacterium]